MIMISGLTIILTGIIVMFLSFVVYAGLAFVISMTLVYGFSTILYIIVYVINKAREIRKHGIKH